MNNKNKILIILLIIIIIIIFIISVSKYQEGLTQTRRDNDIKQLKGQLGNVPDYLTNLKTYIDKITFSKNNNTTVIANNKKNIEYAVENAKGAFSKIGTIMTYEIIQRQTNCELWNKLYKIHDGHEPENQGPDPDITDGLFYMKLYNDYNTHRMKDGKNRWLSGGFDRLMKLNKSALTDTELNNAKSILDIFKKNATRYIEEFNKISTYDKMKSYLPDQKLEDSTNKCKI